MCMMSLGNQGVIELQLGQITAAINKLQAARDAFEAQLGPASPGVHVSGYDYRLRTFTVKSFSVPPH